MVSPGWGAAGGTVGGEEGGGRARRRQVALPFMTGSWRPRGGLQSPGLRRWGRGSRAPQPTFLHKANQSQSEGAWPRAPEPGGAGSGTRVGARREGSCGCCPPTAPRETVGERGEGCSMGGW